MAFMTTPSPSTMPSLGPMAKVKILALEEKADLVMVEEKEYFFIELHVKFVAKLAT